MVTWEGRVEAKNETPTNTGLNFKRDSKITSLFKERQQSMKMLATLMILSALLLTALLPGSATFVESAADTLTANNVGVDSIARPHVHATDRVNENDLDMLIAAKMVIGGRSVVDP